MSSGPAFAYSTTLLIRRTKQAFFQDGVALVPERETKAQALLVVAEPRQAVLARAIGARAR